jgi:hypothetical protein
MSNTETSKGWTRYVNALGVVGLLAGIVYLNPLANPASIQPFRELYEKAVQLTFPAPVVPPKISSIGERYLRDGCPKHQFKSIRLAHRQPDIMIIEGFLTEEEANFLIAEA